MYRLLALAKYDERYVIPPAHAEQAHSLEELATECALDYEGGPGMGGSGPFGEGSGRADADRGGELPDAPGPADLRHVAAPGRQGGAGEPAQLGRQGHPAGPVPAEGRGAVSEPQHARRPSLPAEQLTARLAVGVAAARATPTSELLGRLDLVAGVPRAQLPGAVGEPLRATVVRLETTPLAELQADYVETFDTRRRHNLFLTYFAHGDTRKRGVALLRFKQTYLRSGFVLDASPTTAASCPTTCAWCWSTPRTSTSGSAAACCSTTGPGSSCCGCRCATRGSRVGRRRSRR